MTPRNPDEPNELLPAIIPRESGAPLASLNPLADLAQRFLMWFKFMRQRQPNTIDAYRRDLQAFVAFMNTAGIQSVASISFRELEVFMAWRQHHGASAATVNRGLHALRAFFKWCLREGVLQANPADLVAHLKTTRRLPVYLTITEQERVLGALAKDATLLGQRNYALIATGLLTGLRVEELCNLRPEHVDLETGILRVVRGKGDKDREVPIIARLRVILKDYTEHVRPALLTQVLGCLKLAGPHSTWRACYWENGRQVTRSTRTHNRHDAQAWLEAHVPHPAVSPFVFVHARTHRRTREAEPLLTRTVWDIVNSTAARILAKPLHPHALRHSFAFRIRENDGPLELIGEALGHASIQTTMIYAHISSRKRRADLEKYLTAAG